MDPAQAETALETTAKHIDKLNAASSEVKSTISSLIILTQNPAAALTHLEAFAPLGTIPAYVNVLRNPNSTRRTAVQVDKAALRRVIDLAKADDAAYELVAAIIEVSPFGVKAFGRILEEDAALLGEPRLLHAIGLTLSLPGALPTTVSHAQIAATVVKALMGKDISADTSYSTLGVLSHLAHIDSKSIVQAIQAVEWGAFTIHLSQAALVLAKDGLEGVLPAVRHLVEIGLQWAVRALSSDGEIHQVTFDNLGNLRKSRGAGWDISR
jgi:hypothetical protein